MNVSNLVVAFCVSVPALCEQRVALNFPCPSMILPVNSSIVDTRGTKEMCSVSVSHSKVLLLTW
jgi:hypothetical protein